MPGLLIIAHAPLASSLKAVAEHAFPDCARAVAGATQGVMPVATSRPQNQTLKARGSDQGDHQDQ